MSGPASGRLLNGVLIALGVLAVADNVVLHWILLFHRFKTGWPGSIYVEAALVVLGLIMVWAGVRRERRAVRRTGDQVDR